MKHTESKTQRIHALDSARGIMMLLGIVIHTALTYGPPIENVWAGLYDTEDSMVFFGHVTDFIHVFRMPAFFVIAGFFGALLFYERSPRTMIMNRINRVALPLGVFVLLLFPLVRMAWTSSLYRFNDKILRPIELWNIYWDGTRLPDRTMHLWFLYYLAMISLVFWLAALGLKRLPKVTASITAVFDRLNQNPFLRPLLFAVVTFTTFYYMNSFEAIAPASTAWTPVGGTFLYYAVFYGYGWILLKSRPVLLSFKNHDWLLFGIGCSLFILKINLYDYDDERGIQILLMGINALCVWLLVFSINGLFLRYANGHSPSMRYMSDSAYWVYLIHLPIVALIPGYLVGIGMPTVLKFFITLIGTTVVSFATYHFFVRSTFIGHFLNGRRYSTKKVH